MTFQHEFKPFYGLRNYEGNMSNIAVSTMIVDSLAEPILGLITHKQTLVGLTDLHDTDRQDGRHFCRQHFHLDFLKIKLSNLK